MGGEGIEPSANQANDIVRPALMLRAAVPAAVLSVPALPYGEFEHQPQDVQSTAADSTKSQVDNLLGLSSPLTSDPSGVARHRRRIGWGPIFGAGLLILFGVAGSLGPLVSTHDPLHVNLAIAYLPPAFLHGGNWAYPLGTDQLGRDVLVRLLGGARISLLVGITAVLLSGTFGLLVGVTSGYVGGWLDSFLMRLADSALAFPFFLLAIMLAAIFGPSTKNVIIIICVAGWASYARVIRSQVLSLKTQDFVIMAKVMGAGNGWVILRHLIPNVMGSLLVLATLQLGYAILTEGSLSFIGVGVPPPAPSWGGMLAESRALLGVAWWLPALPGFALFMVVMASNFMGDWLGDR